MKRWLQRTVALIGRSVLNFHRDNCLNLSATVAFYALLSLGPLVYLAGATLGWFFRSSEALELAIERAAAFLPEAIAPALRRVAPQLRTDKGLVLLTVPALLWVATTVFSSLEAAVNVAFGSARRRSLWRGRLKAFAILGLACVALGVTITFRASVSLRAEYAAFLSLAAAPSLLDQILSYLALMAASFLVFLLFYKWLPRTSVSWRAAGAGALFSLVLWDGARRVFGEILLRSPAFGVLTGALAGVVGFLLWIYTAVAIFLLGAELAALVNRSRGTPTVS
jgi:membrane protein